MQRKDALDEKTGIDLFLLGQELKKQMDSLAENMPYRDSKARTTSPTDMIQMMQLPVDSAHPKTKKYLAVKKVMSEMNEWYKVSNAEKGIQQNRLLDIHAVAREAMSELKTIPATGFGSKISQSVKGFFSSAPVEPTSDSYKAVKNIFTLLDKAIKGDVELNKLYEARQQQGQKKKLE